MNEATRKKLLYGLLVAAVIFGIYNFTHPRKPYAPSGDVAASPEPQAQAQVSTASMSVNLDAVKTEPWGEDPFRRSYGQPRFTRAIASEPVYTPHWSLSGIIYNSSLPMAIINGSMVKVGDTVDKAQVVAIQQKTVTLLYNGSRMEIRVAKG